MIFKKSILLLAVLITALPLLAKEQTDSLPDTVWTKWLYYHEADNVKFLPDGQHFINYTNYSTQIRKVKDGEIIKEFKGDSVLYRPLDISKTKKMVAGANGNNVLVADYETGNILAKLSSEKLLKFEERQIKVTSVSFSGDGEHLAVIFFSRDKKMDFSLDTSILIIWNTNTWTVEKSKFLIGTDEFYITYSPTNDYMMICQYNNYYSDTLQQKYNYVGLINTSTWEGSLVKKPYITYSSSNQGFKFSPDGKKVSLICSYRESDAVKQGIIVWDIPNVNNYRIIKDYAVAVSLAYSNDSKYLANFAANPSRIDIRGLENLQKVFSYPLDKYFTENLPAGEGAYSIDISPDNNYMLSGGGGLILYNAKWNITDVKTEDINKETIIYPNPSDGKVNIKFSISIPDIIKVSIIDFTGNIIENIYEGMPVIGENFYQWDSKLFPPGIYFCEIKGKMNNQIIKIIRTR